jgi:ATP-dependent Clp protease ATP-binding subunit ClpA
MFERFDVGARHCLIRAADEARRRQSAAVGTAAVLVGIASTAGVGQNALAACGMTIDNLAALTDEAPTAAPPKRPAGERLRPKVGGHGPLAHVRRRQEVPDGGRLPFGAEAVTAFDLAGQEADRLGQASINTGHVLLGLLRAGDPSTRRALAAAGVTADDLQAAVLTRITGGPPRAQ